MPPIRTFISAPINPNARPVGKDNDNTSSSTSNAVLSQSQTPHELPNQRNESTPAFAPATTTAHAAGSLNQEYPPAQPGAPVVPPPTTGAVPSHAAAYTPTPTKTSSSPYYNYPDSPAPPQPGARPIPPGSTTTPAAAAINTNTATPSKSKAYTVPPPPKTGEVVQPASYYAPKAVETTTSPQNPAVPNSTSTPYASMYQPPSTSTTTAARDFDRSRELGVSPSPFSTGAGNKPFGGGGGGGGGGGAGLPYAGNDNEDSILGESGQNILDTAKLWMQRAGTKLAEAEAEVWKMVNSKS